MRSRWLGTLPDHWRAGRLLELASAWTSNVDKHTVEGQVPVRLCNYTDVYKNDEITADLDFMTATATPDQIERFRLRRGDTIITKDSETADDIGIPAYVDHEADDLVCGYHLAIVRPHQTTDPKYLYWVMRSRAVLDQWAVTAAGVTRVGIRSTDLTKVTVPVPPRSEQRVIAAFLDVETAKIDALIATQERLLPLLRARRETCVARAVTQGLGSSVVGTDRTIAWGRNSPSSWMRAPLATFFDERSEYVSDRDFAPLSVTKDGVVPQLSTVAKTDNNDHRKLVRAGDFAINSRSDRKGSAGVSPLDGSVSVVYTVLTPRANLDARFAHYLLRSTPFQEEYYRWGSGIVADLWSTRYSSMKRIPIAAPPLAEQREIAAHVEAETFRIDTLIAKAEEHIALARERRAALVTAAVTGQIDVTTASSRVHA